MAIKLQTTRLEDPLLSRSKNFKHVNTVPSIVRTYMYTVLKIINFY